MKVSGTAGAGAAAARRTDRRAGRPAGGSAFRLPSVSEAVDTPKAAGAEPAAAADALLSLQEVPDATNGRSKGLQHGADLLAILDQIRHGLLLGRIPPERLQKLSQFVQERQENTTDPRLSALLGEIELRAAVELAKFRMAG